MPTDRSMNLSLYSLETSLIWRLASFLYMWKELCSVNHWPQMSEKKKFTVRNMVYRHLGGH